MGIYPELLAKMEALKKANDSGQHVDPTLLAQARSDIRAAQAHANMRKRVFDFDEIEAKANPIDEGKIIMHRNAVNAQHAPASAGRVQRPVAAEPNGIFRAPVAGVSFFDLSILTP